MRSHARARRVFSAHRNSFSSHRASANRTIENARVTSAHRSKALTDSRATIRIACRVEPSKRR